ncbi:hypothetical protein KC318_g5267 [Hortaea werneckii]|uniref:Ig-like domain-containing protein n=1 Tax=Hortaea werneckii TaxID=91943 RepID=A0A3M7A7B0_HORWE|nr:hypothetical protein KC334_g6279 [Hortaea werneckii]KAI7010552.1 hypothetical protein KC355_g6132 [Hortaea werneckii]KAI7668470.1 hypothetical protein KC318_g5267 [Hortaea werneckii]RMY12831.1 hypothetical protein D0867_07638 [Hortaea werneckii]RMY23282.1 hypothetical protein D0866_11702 [Hortaea werneckii]
MYSKAALLAVGAFATTAIAQSASVTITASHGGAGNGLTNTTITVPLGSLYTNAALDEVSYLYLTGSNDAVLESITCTPHRYANGTGEAGRPFTSSSPSLLSTNTVKVGSLTCVASDSNDANATSGTSSSSNTGMPTSSSVAATSAAASNGTNHSLTTLSATPSSSEGEDATRAAGAAATTPMTSTFLTTISGTSSEDGQTSAPQQQSTVTSVMSASGSTTVTSTLDDGAAETAASETTSSSSAPASLSAENGAPKLRFGEAIWPGLAVGALGVAMVV